MKYTVKAETAEGCDCEDCRAGRHIYSLFRWTEGGWEWAGTSLQTYSSAEEAKRKHPWMIDFGPGATWEDGTPIVEPEYTPQPSPDGQPPSPTGMVQLNTEALGKSFELLKKHWGASGEQ